jgi:hypothetical protein
LQEICSLSAQETLPHTFAQANAAGLLHINKPAAFLPTLPF